MDRLRGTTSFIEYVWNKPVTINISQRRSDDIDRGDNGVSRLCPLITLLSLFCPCT